jgi:hypothetical protein
MWGQKKGRQRVEMVRDLSYIYLVGRQWLTPVILAAEEAEIRRITVQSYPGQIVRETLS